MVKWIPQVCRKIQKKMPYACKVQSYITRRVLCTPKTSSQSEKLLLNSVTYPWKYLITKCCFTEDNFKYISSALRGLLPWMNNGPTIWRIQTQFNRHTVCEFWVILRLFRGADLPSILPPSSFPSKQPPRWTPLLLWVHHSNHRDETAPWERT